MDDNEFFTVVFKGDLRKFAKSPFKIETEFGEVQAVGVGNAYDEIEELTAEIEKCMEAMDG